MGFLRDIARALGLVKKERGAGPPPPSGVSKPTVLGSDPGPKGTRAQIMAEAGLSKTKVSKKGKKLSPRARLTGVDPSIPTVLGG